MYNYFFKYLILLICILLLFSSTAGSQPDFELYPHVYKSRPDLPSPYITSDGRELITIKTLQGFLLVPVTQENGEIYSCMYYLSGKGKQLYVGNRDFLSLGKSGLHSDAELDKKIYITGRKIELINYLARPGGFSRSGFIGGNENIISVLKNDNRIVKLLGLKHNDLAKPLFHVWNSILGKYLSKRSVNNAIIFYNDHKIVINAEAGKGYQESIFHDEVEGKWNIHIKKELKESELKILNKIFPLLSKEKMSKFITRLTGIQISEMNPFYIMRYGFYEGHTDFRADPVAITLIFGLRSLKDIINILGKDLYKIMCPE
ncbi:MAG: hypothetical protein KAS21_05175 [Candidatus Aminicenantes bacterium]|nr:hypothetical protein [Candidatus Aminicenantes bacterium]MCK5004456.1 hypothetical protein [Candidatus Aminicenantes bacterium]